MKMLRSVAALLAVLLLCSCTIAIFHEDTAVGVYAPEINPEPEAGAMERTTLQLYFPMANDTYMCSQSREKEVPVSSGIETILLNALLLEGPMDTGDLTALFDSNVKATVTTNGSLIEVTLSNEYLHKANVVDEAREKERRKLSIYCIVNTLTQYDTSLSVQMMVEAAGTSRKLTYEEAGMTKPKNSPDALEPLTFTTDSILTLRKAADRVLRAVSSRDAQTLYRYLLADSRPPEDELQTALYGAHLIEYNINSDSETNSNVTVDLTLQTKTQGSEPVKLLSKTIPFLKEGDVWKVDYRSLESLIFIEEETPSPSATVDMPAD